MTKAEVVAEISTKTGIEKKDVSAIVEGFLSIVTKSVIAGDGVYIRGFGAFERTHRKEKIGNDMGRKKSIIIPAHYVPTFKVYPEFKDALK